MIKKYNQYIKESREDIDKFRLLCNLSQQK